MSDLISRQEAIRIAEQGQVQGYEWQFKELVKLPSVTPQEPTDTWSIKDVADTFKKHGLIVEQEFCEDEYIKVPKKALKYRTAGMVAYNAEWLKNHFDIERAVICGVQEPKTDVLDKIRAELHATAEMHEDDDYYLREEWIDESINKYREQEPKTGHWIEQPEIETSTPEYLMFYECSECDDKQCFCKSDIHKKKFCSNCGCRMVEPQESEDKE